MKIRTIEIDEQFWGELTYYEMPYPDVFFICTRRNEGYVVPADYHGKVLSQRALSFGQEHQGLIYFSMDITMTVVRYELFMYRLQNCPSSQERELYKKSADISRQYGRVDCPAYFGEYPPPNDTPYGIVEAFRRVRNGVYFAEAGGEWYFSVCIPIAESELTTIARPFGKETEDYLYFDLDACAIALFELAGSYPELARLIRSKEALNATLWNHFRTYAMEYNDQRGAADPSIPETAPAGNESFLSFDEKP